MTFFVELYAVIGNNALGFRLACQNLEGVLYAVCRAVAHYHSFYIGSACGYEGVSEVYVCRNSVCRLKRVHKVNETAGEAVSADVGSGHSRGYEYYVIVFCLLVKEGTVVICRRILRHSHSIRVREVFCDMLSYQCGNEPSARAGGIIYIRAHRSALLGNYNEKMLAVS